MRSNPQTINSQTSKVTKTTSRKSKTAKRKSKPDAEKQQAKGNERVDNLYSDKIEFDKFYTLESVAIECLQLLDLSSYDLVIEPSAGNGSFFRNINHPNIIGLDIKPECSSVLEQDWFSFEIDKSYKNVLIVGNPPFGKRNNLSKSFLKHAASFRNVRTIAFVLPDVYFKATLQLHIPKEFRLKHIKKLPQNSFVCGEKIINMPCSFFIFDKSEGPDLRELPLEHMDTNDFEFGSAKKFDFFAKGAAPNTILEFTSSNNRGHYIKVKDGVDVERVKENFRKCHWTAFSSTSGGSAWRPQDQIVREYRKTFES
jgi:hypothetical protein